MGKRRSLRALHWNEALHPRDDKGRFSKKGGQRWAGRVLGGYQAAFGDVRAHDAAHGIRAGRLPGGVINLQQAADQGRDQSMERRVDLGSVTLGDRVKVGGEWRVVHAVGSERGHRFVGWRSADSSKVGTLREDKTPTVVKAQTFEASFKQDRPLRGEAVAQMRAWEADARKPAPFKLPGRREANIAATERKLTAAEIALAEAIRKARNRANRKFPKKAGHDQYERDRYVADETASERYQVRSLSSTLDTLTQRPPGPDDNRLATNAFPEFTGKVNPDRPLAVYGDLLHAQAYDEATHRHLAVLATIAPELHRVVAADMYRVRETGRLFRGPDDPEAGVHVGSTDVTKVGNLRKYLGNRQPRGWSKGDTFAKVNGVYTSTYRTLAVGHTDNSNSLHDRTGAHEFGHALDAAIGTARRMSDPTYVQAEESATKQWRSLYRRAVAAAGPRMNPYFRQKGDAGPQELWAEAFAFWHDVSHRQTQLLKADGGDPTRNPGLESVRQKTKLMLGKEFDIKDDQVLDDMFGYFSEIAAWAGAQ